MVRALVESRQFISFLLSAGLGLAGFYRLPFPSDNALLALVRLQKPGIFLGIKWSFTAMLFTTPYVTCSVLFSLAYIFIIRQEKTVRAQRLPMYPPAATRGNSSSWSARSTTRSGRSRWTNRTGSPSQNAGFTPAPRFLALSAAARPAAACTHLRNKSFRIARSPRPIGPADSFSK